MISHITGVLIAKDIDRIDVMTPGGVGYELQIPLGVFETLPRVSEKLSLHTYLVVKEDGWQLFGFSSVFERRLFQKLLTANGVGPALALGLMSALSAQRLVRAIQEKDIATLQGVPRVGRKKAERLILDLADKLDGLGGADDSGDSRVVGSGASEDAMRALVSLGYSTADAERGVRAALDAGGGGLSAPDLIRAALAKLGGR
jgi:Holliday junction DNA helicase RuvA